MKRLFCLLPFVLLCDTVSTSRAAVIFTNGSTWKYFIGTQEASTPTTAWRDLAFSDSSWQQGLLPIGFAAVANDPGGYEATIRTTLPTGSVSNYASVFLRKSFVVASTNDFAQLRLTVVVDDGCIAWVNGREIGRFNMVSGEPNINSVAISSIESTVATFVTNNPGAFLVAGTNIVAVQLFNAVTNSSDLLLDASLSGIEPDTTAPTIAAISPAPGPVANTLNQISVTFSEPVTGVDAADLLINGAPAASLTSTNNTYVFSFVQPPFGPVQIAWAANHGIHDLGVSLNPFDATASGATWQYSLQDRIPPTLLNVSPQPGFTLRSLTQIELHFSKPVQGVDAADLRISGTPASGLTVLDASKYIFTFTQPATGAVQVTWSPSHGITDLATPPNAFVSGGGWSYVLNPNAAAPNIIITEFLAANTTWRGTGPPPANKLVDEDGDFPDWIEIFNAGDVEADLAGWHLTDDPTLLTKWTFPSTNLAAKSYMVVFASQKDRAIPGNPLHTNFKLSSGGEYLAIVKPDGVTISTEFAPVFPPQIDDVSFGLPTLTTSSALISTNSTLSAFIPVNNDLALDWTLSTFSDAGWISGTNGVGFETATNPPPSLRSFISTDLQAQMFNQSASLFIRIPFVVDDASRVDGLKLRLRYDDGFVAYLNGQEVARGNASPDAPFGEPLSSDSHAVGNRTNTISIASEEFDLSSIARNGGLQSGTNILAIHGLNYAANDGDFLIFAELISEHREIQLTQTRYFTVPTPGADNGAGTENLGPIISDVINVPAVPKDNEDIVVTAGITRTFAAVAQVTLNYRVMYGAVITIPMLDDGQHGDGAAQDGIYGATIPASASNPGQMVRWYVRATDTQGQSLRLPAFSDPVNSPEYFGTVIFLPQTNNLSVLHWFMQNPASADSDAGTRGSLFYLGQFYDNIAADLHGQSSRGFPKHSYDISFNTGYPFSYDLKAAPVHGINLLTTYPDKAHMRNMLSYGVYHDSGSPYYYVIPVRVQLNGQFYGDWDIVENGDEHFLERIGKDPNGALYKMYSTFTSPTTDVVIGSGIAEKKTRKDEGNADLVDLMNGVRLTGTSRVNYVYDNLNIPEMVNFLAAKIITGDIDCCHKNYYFYRDTEGTGEWEGFPWDVDLSFGRVWNATDNYWDPALYPATTLDIGNNNGVFSVIISGTAQTRLMYLRRIRTLMDQLLGSPNTPLPNFEGQIDKWTQLIAPDAALDAIAWPFASTWGNGFGAGSPTSTCCTQSMPQAALDLKISYLPQRRAYLFNTLASTLPPPQPTNTFVQIRSLEYSPTNGNQAQEYIELFNTNTYAVDISGWKISGAVDFTFQAGVVIPPATSLYVSPDVRSWLARTTGPGGGRGLFVQGNYQGQLSARGETVLLADNTGRQVTSLTYPGSPSPAQQYLRITEIMYHPSRLTGNTNSAEEFEYLELKNIGPTAVSLIGVRFGDGVEFDFSTSSVSNLAAGQRVLVVKNLVAFTARYGSALPVAGAYTGNLDNSGERIRLVDAVNEEILDFSYNNSWYPITDGLGFSLVIVDENAPPDNWGHKDQWRPSSEWQGSPGQNDQTVPQFSPVLVNEALTRTLAVPDAIELYNPGNNAVDISGWYLTDDFNTPQKFRIPNGTIIPANGYLSFNETQFNPQPGVPPSFALSAAGDEVYLFGADLAGILSGYVHGFEFDAAEEEVSFGRYITSQGEEHFVRQSAVTLNATNAGPKVGPIVISEIMYHPFDLGTEDNTQDEFIELLNITTNTVPLYDSSLPTNTWHLTGGADFTFPTNVSLKAGEALLVVNFSPSDSALLTDFQARFGIAPDLQVFGPLQGKLNNDSDKINLKMPTSIIGAHVPYALVDRVEYRDLPPWPTAADGLGSSLQRRNISAYGDDPMNWVAARPSPGTPTVTNAVAPQITLQPQSRAYLGGQTASLTAQISGTAPFSYQWRFNGANLIGATSLTLDIPNAQVQNAGDYQLIVYNAGGSILSDVAHISVRAPVAILTQPQTIDVRIQPDPQAAPNTNVTFTVSAYSSAPVHYQWRRNGIDIPNATNSSYTVVSVKTNDLANFSVLVYDDLSSLESATVGLFPLISPTFVETPQPQSVAVNSRVSLSAQVTGFPTPFTFEWRLVATLIASNIQDDPVSFFNFTASSVPATNNYRLVVKNRAAPTGRATGFIGVITLADSDGDGIPDQWENLYKFNPTNSADRFADPDGDGMANWQEYIAGTDPTNALSNLKLTSTGWSNGVLRLQFQAVSNKTYAVQYTSTLSDTNWSILTRSIGRRTNHVEQITDPAPPANRFYRVVTPTP